MGIPLSSVHIWQSEATSPALDGLYGSLLKHRSTISFTLWYVKYFRHKILGWILFVSQYFDDFVWICNYCNMLSENMARCHRIDIVIDDYCLRF